MNQRRALLEHVAERLMQRKGARPGVLKVAIDGVDGAGKTYFADELADLLRASGQAVIRASVDGFHQPRRHRYRLGRDSAEGFYRDSYDYAALKRELLEPLQADGGLYRTAVFDVGRDEPLAGEALQASGDEILLLDGLFLHRPELRDLWEDSVFLRVGFATSVPRGAGRGAGYGDPDPRAPSNQRYIGGQQLYFAEAQPEQYAGMVIDNTELEKPVLISS